MEISDVDQMGCEDPDLDADTTAHTLYELEHELRLLNRGTNKNTLYIHKSYVQTHRYGIKYY